MFSLCIDFLGEVQNREFKKRIAFVPDVIIEGL